MYLPLDKKLENLEGRLNILVYNLNKENLEKHYDIMLKEIYTDISLLDNIYLEYNSKGYIMIDSFNDYKYLKKILDLNKKMTSTLEKIFDIIYKPYLMINDNINNENIVFYLLRDINNIDNFINNLYLSISSKCNKNECKNNEEVSILSLPLLLYYIDLSIQIYSITLLMEYIDINDMYTSLIGRPGDIFKIKILDAYKNLYHYIKGKN